MTGHRAKRIEIETQRVLVGQIMGTFDLSCLKAFGSHLVHLPQDGSYFKTTARKANWVEIWDSKFLFDHKGGCR